MDVQGADVTVVDEQNDFEREPVEVNDSNQSFIDTILKELKLSERPILLLGGGLKREVAKSLARDIEKIGVPVMTTWNGMDRYGDDLENYWGRPNTWGQRSSNLLLQQCDLLIAVGTRLGLQQTGFAWEEFAPLAKIYQIDIDKAEILKGHPKIEAGLQADAGAFLSELVTLINKENYTYSKWLEFGNVPLPKSGS